MAELTIDQLIKLILGILVFVAVVIGAYFIFKEKIFSFFETVEIPEFWGVLIRWRF
jgi:hypothetical protein